MSKEFKMAPFDSMMGIEIIDSKPQFAKISLSFQERLSNPYGSLHGGAISTLVDSAMAIAVLSTYPDNLFYTRRLSIKFISQVKRGAVFAEAYITEQKKNFLFGKVLIKNADNRLIAEALTTFVLNNK